MRFKIIAGPDPFAGISNSSKEKAINYANNLSSKKKIDLFLKSLFKAGVRRVMFYFNSDLVRSLNKNFEIYPIVPNASEYIRDINKYGMVKTGIRKVMSLGIINLIKLGFWAPKNALKVLKRNFRTMLALLIKIELMQMKKLRVNVVFLHYQITDMALANENAELISFFVDLIRKEYKYEPGLMTQNFSELTKFIQNNGLKVRAIATPYNKKGFMMKPSKKECEQVNKFRFNVYALEPLAGETIKQDEAKKYLSEQKIDKLVLNLGTREDLRKYL